MDAFSLPTTLPAYRDELRHALGRLRAGEIPHVPSLMGLRRRRPRMHFHADAEFFIQTGGRSRFKCPGESFVLEQGRTCVIPAGVPHGETPENARHPYGIIVCLRTREGVMLQRARSGRDGAIICYGAVVLPGSGIRDAFDFLNHVGDPSTHLASDESAHRHALTEAFLLTALAALERPEAVAPAGSPLVIEAEKLALAALSDPALTIAKLARSLGCTANHLSRVFAAERGLALKTWIGDERIALARELLRDSRHQVAEVGWTCGFSRPSYFIRVFTARTGLSPGKFRRRAASSQPTAPISP